HQPNTLDATIAFKVNPQYVDESNLDIRYVPHPQSAVIAPTASAVEKTYVALPAKPPRATEARKAVQPTFRQVMPKGPNTMTVINSLNTWIGVGVFCQKVGPAYQYGIIKGLQNGGSFTIGIPNG